MARQVLKAMGTSPGLKLDSPGRRTCEMDRPDLSERSDFCKNKYQYLTHILFNHVELLFQLSRIEGLESRKATYQL